MGSQKNTPKALNRDDITDTELSVLEGTPGTGVMPKRVSPGHARLRRRAEAAGDLFLTGESWAHLSPCLVAPERRKLFLLSFSKPKCCQGVTQRGHAGPLGTGSHCPVSQHAQSGFPQRTGHLDFAMHACVHMSSAENMCESPLCLVPGRQRRSKADSVPPSRAFPFQGLWSQPHLPSFSP